MLVHCIYRGITGYNLKKNIDPVKMLNYAAFNLGIPLFATSIQRAVANLYVAQYNQSTNNEIGSQKATLST